MAVTPRIQPEGGESRQGGGGKQFVIVKKGDYELLKTEAEALETYYEDAAAPSGKSKVLSWKLDHCPAGQGKLTVTTQQLGKKEKVPGTEVQVDSVRYTIRNVQTSVPIIRYCGISEGANAYAHDIMMWRAESEKERYEAYQYNLPSGGVVTLSEPSKKLAKKYQLGIEEVMRFYPVVQRITQYAPGTDADEITGIAAKLAHIDTPPKMATLAAAWLKIQDELDIASDGIVTRTEGWQGAESFDQNLYGNGAERWEFGSI